MLVLLVLAFLFFAGSLIGWCIELVWRRFFSKNNHEHKWINPGFLTGPYLPLYGFSLVILFALSHINVSFIHNIVLQKTVLFILMALSITFFEYIAGLIFIKGLKVKLWDYSTCWGNIQGIICPLYTLFWYILSAVYYFLVHPRILNWLYWFTNHMAFCFVVGFFYGVFTIDVIYSLNIMVKLRKLASKSKIVIHLEKMQHYIRCRNMEAKQKMHFWLSLKSESLSFTDSRFIEDFKEFARKLKNI